MQVRPGPMVTAAATAVIIVSLAGLAVLTGVLPFPAPANGGASNAMPVLVTGAKPLTAYASPLAPASAMTTASDAQRPRLPAPNALLPGATLPGAPLPGAPMPGTPLPRAPLSAATSPPVPPAVPPAAAATEPPAMAGQSRHPLPAVRRGRSPHDGPSTHMPYRQRAHAPAASQPGTSRKTREQVIAELLEAKRNGTYPANSDLYR